ncbi:cell wall hydrolase [Sphingomonas sp. CROZ-RG-20F-R02-07]|uniref:cell wall hydrolase n=1 Tax=Sphingomonas sp. CROZ-RG-20F-R02-07 TaxID=2914832 RepID=UPI001F566D23|nr:cell wall hydrolase [Sphingomonas sp. CROZ-RG-20F-R02-07]
MRRIDAVPVAIAALAVIAPTIVVTHPPAIPDRIVRPAALPKRRIVPMAEVPPVEPVAFIDMSPDEARAYNADVPFSTEPNPAARPFRMSGPPEAQARATDCLAAAVVYEAGDDAEGERAVAQVVLNRLRHPAFPKTVCGVVFQGQERSTGCQFTFACDGALDRWHPSDAAWRRAREVAHAALAGSVDRPVGYATHYHTDWVVPYWQSSLDKIAAVHTHLFFRWAGWWGTPPAFNRQVSSDEPVIAHLAALSEAHRTATEIAGADDLPVSGDGEAVLPTDSDPDAFLLLLPAGQPADSYKAMALRLCGIRAHCQVMGWTDPALVATALPLTAEQVSTLAFSYLHDRPSGYDKALWNCQTVRRANPAECMKRQTVLPNAAATPAPDLGGVRRKSTIEPPPTNSQAPE